VVGAGIIGCAVARELAVRDANVAIVDARDVGRGATHASAGVLAPYIEARENAPLSALAARSLEMYDEFVAGVEADSGLSVTYRRTGTLDVALKDDQMRCLEGAAADLANRGVVAELLDAHALRREEPQIGTGAVGGLHIPSHGFVAAGDLIAALAGAAKRHGVELLERSRVTRVSPAGGALAIHTDRGTLQAGGVVVAAGSWSGQLAIDGVADPAPIRPVRGQLLHLAWSGPRLRRVTWAERCYLVPWDDGTLLVGATVEEAGFDERTTVAGVRDLIEAACELVPRAWTAALIAAKVGLRPASADGLPVIGSSSVYPNLMYATGHFRNGILLAPLTAQLVADVMLQHRSDPMLALTRPQRFGEL